MSQQLLEKEMTVSQILRTYGQWFTQIQKKYSDGFNGRCAVGVIMSYYGWDGKESAFKSRKLFAALFALRHAGVSVDLVTDLNDSGMTFDEIADFLDRNRESQKLNNYTNDLLLEILAVGY
jgi:hypothetical protein